jgi:hypothetical protein
MKSITSFGTTARVVRDLGACDSGIHDLTNQGRGKPWGSENPEYFERWSAPAGCGSYRRRTLPEVRQLE